MERVVVRPRWWVELVHLNLLNVALYGLFIVYEMSQSPAGREVQTAWALGAFTLMQLLQTLVQVVALFLAATPRDCVPLFALLHAMLGTTGTTVLHPSWALRTGTQRRVTARNWLALPRSAACGCQLRSRLHRCSRKRKHFYASRRACCRNQFRPVGQPSAILAPFGYRREHPSLIHNFKPTFLLMFKEAESTQISSQRTRKHFCASRYDTSGCTAPRTLCRAVVRRAVGARSPARRSPESPLTQAIPSNSLSTREIESRTNAMIFLSMTLYPCLGMWVLERAGPWDLVGVRLL